MTTARKIGFGVLILLAALAAALYYGYANLDRIVQAAIEKYGSQVTGTEVTLAEVQLGLAEGKAALGGLRIANPQGFSANAIFNLERIAVTVDPASLTTATIVIPEVLIDAPYILYEIDPRGDSNMQALKRAIDRVVPKKKDTPSATGGDEAGKKIIIRRLVIDRGRTDVDLTALLDRSMTAQLPRIELTHIGEKSGGVTPEEAGRIVLDALTKNTEGLVAGMGVEQMIDAELQKQMGKAGEAARKALTEKLGEKAGEEAAKTAEETLKGILGGGGK